MLDREFMVMLGTYRRMIRRNANENVRKIIKKTHVADLAALFRSFTERECRIVFDLISENEYKANLLAEMDDKILVDLLKNLDAPKIVELVNELAPDDQADLVANLPPGLEKEVLELLSSAKSENLEELMSYPPETAGGIMVPLPFKMYEDDTARDAINAVQLQENIEMVFYIYIVDENEKLSGTLSMRQLLISDPLTKLKDVMNSDVITVFPEDDQEEVARITSRYDFLALPVIDHNQKLLGIVTVDDIIDVIREEATEDFLQMAGVGKDREILLKTPVQSARMRLPWLFATFLGGFVVSMIVMEYETLVNQFVLLAAFMPVVAGMGGNVGTQSSTIIVRGLATGRINVNQLAKVLFRQMQIGLFLGLIYGILIALFTVLYYHGQVQILRLGISIGAGLLLAMLIAATAGTLTPLLLDKFHIDPAVATGPIVTTTVDVIGVVVYFGIASVLLTNL